MHTYKLTPPLRLVASGGPVSRVCASGRGEERTQAERLRNLAESIRYRMMLDCMLLQSVERAADREEQRQQGTLA